MSVCRLVRLTLSRQQQFSLAGYRTPTIQRVRLGADRSGRLAALDHEVFEQTSTVYEFASMTKPLATMYDSSSVPGIARNSSGVVIKIAAAMNGSIMRAPPAPDASRIWRPRKSSRRPA